MLHITRSGRFRPPARHSDALKQLLSGVFPAEMRAWLDSSPATEAQRQTFLRQAGTQLRRFRARVRRGALASAADRGIPAQDPPDSDHGSASEGDGADDASGQYAPQTSTLYQNDDGAEDSDTEDGAPGISDSNASSATDDPEAAQHADAAPGTPLPSSSSDSDSSDSQKPAAKRHRPVAPSTLASQQDPTHGTTQSATQPTPPPPPPASPTPASNGQGPARITAQPLVFPSPPHPRAQDPRSSAEYGWID